MKKNISNYRKIASAVLVIAVGVCCMAWMVPSLQPQHENMPVKSNTKTQRMPDKAKGHPEAHMLEVLESHAAGRPGC